jgi:hypothetical protein
VSELALSDAGKQQRSSKALRVPGFTAPLTVNGLTVNGLTVNGLTVNGPINCCIFLAWVRQHPVPTLASGDIVVMDYLSSH